MKIAKHYVARIVLGMEMLIFSGFYFFGTNGLSALRHLKKDIKTLDQQVLHLKGEISHLQSSIALQKKHPFFQEKIAREQLQMARADEEIYLINN